MKKRFKLGFLAAVAAFWLIGGMVSAQAQSECDFEPLLGPARAFCQAFCEFGRCTTTEEQPPGIEQACDNVRAAYENATGDRLPCLGAVCPCDVQYFINNLGTLEVCDAVGPDRGIIGSSLTFTIDESATYGPFVCDITGDGNPDPTPTVTNLTPAEADACWNELIEIDSINSFCFSSQ